MRNGSYAYVREHFPRNITIPWSPVVEPRPACSSSSRRARSSSRRLPVLPLQTLRREFAELERILGHMEESYQRDEMRGEGGLAFYVAQAIAIRNFFIANALQELWIMRRGKMWTTVRRRLVSRKIRQDALVIRRRVLQALKHRKR